MPIAINCGNYLEIFEYILVWKENTENHITKRIYKSDRRQLLWTNRGKQTL